MKYREVPRPPEMSPEMPQPPLKKRRTGLYIGVVLAVILLVSVLLIGLSIKQFSGQQPVETKLTIDVPSAMKGKPVTIKAILEDKNGNSIQNVDIEFLIQESGSWKAMSSAKTNASGIVSISYTPLTTGTFQVKAIFKGTTGYIQSSSTVATLNVSIDYGPLTSYVQELKNKGFEVLQGTWKEPQYYASIPDWDNFVKWAEQVRGEHQQKGRSDPVIYVDLERSVFWLIGKIALFNYDDVTFYWFV